MGTRTETGMRGNLRRTFYWRGGYDTRAVPKEAGFTWDGSDKAWSTEDVEVARSLARHADPMALRALAA